MLATVLALAGTTWADARRPVVRGAADETGRARRTVGAGVLVVLVVLAGISLQQFRLAAASASPSSGVGLDPIAALSPVLTLLALAVAGVALTGPVMRVLERRTSAGAGLVPSRPSRQLARRAPVYASALLVLAFATGGLVLAASVDGSWRAIDGAAAAAAVGGDARVAVDGPAVTDDRAVGTASASTTADPDGAAAAARVPRRGAHRFRARRRAGHPGGRSPGGRARSGIRAQRGGPRCARRRPSRCGARGGPPGAPRGVGDRPVRSTARAGPGTAAPAASLTVWVQGPDGVAVRHSAGEVAPGAPTTVETSAIPTPGTTLLGVEAQLIGTGTLGVDVSIVGTGLAGTVEVTSREPSARVPAVAAGTPLPVLVDRRLSDRIAAVPGDEFEVRLRTGGAEATARVVVVVDVVPAVEPGVLIDLGALTAAAFADGAGVPEPTEVWLSGERASDAANALAGTPGFGTAVQSRDAASGSDIVQSAVTAVWLGAIGAALFALVALAGLASASASTRSGEVAVLRALGATARMQSHARRDELVGLSATAVVLGTAIGLLVAWLTSADLALAATPDAAAGLDAVLSPAWVPLAVALAGLAAGCLIIASDAARSAAARASTALPGQDDD
ncbi:hypothetical protein [Agromyces marinus]|uniref:hypothetical protein n=1 Tax=Agromyces marinus TaxID=1389020 RepID=UPI001F27E7F4|nr:hypothetical protein [Agromyces marinus]UIP59355.1 hypothetical protein DSM26151_22620 [Agromyces marinus]